MTSVEQLAKNAYQAYCRQAGGKTFDGKPLPTFEQLGADRQACWKSAVAQVRTDIQAVH